MNKRQLSFIETIRAAGFEPPDQVTPGQFCRFPGKDKTKSNQAGWCILFEDCKGGEFGDWSCDYRESWFAANAQHHACDANGPSRKASRNDWKIVARQRHAIQERAAQKATWLWSCTTKAEHHPYLKLKGIRARGSRILSSKLVLPILDFDGQLTSLQLIDSQGGKRMLMGGRKKGCFIPVSGYLTNLQQLIICEGYATGSTLADGNPGVVVIAAIDAGNLKLVAITARRMWPAANITIAGDDDRLTEGNPGATKAREAAIACGGCVILPEWPDEAPGELTDFNDLEAWRRRVES